MNDNEHVRMTAKMEGEESIVRNIGHKVKVSEMELICLANFAEIGVLAIFSELDGPTGVSAGKELIAHIAGIQRDFKSLTNLQASTVAMLRGRFFKYLVEKESQ